jgi:hypothetical protein
MAIQAYQVHASLQVLAFISLLLGTHNARKHRMKIHHRFVYSAVAFSTLAVTIMLLQSGGLPTLHGKLGFSTYILMSISAFSGRLFLRRRVNRGQHRALASLAMLMLLFTILDGLFTFVFALL